MGTPCRDHSGPPLTPDLVVDSGVLPRLQVCWVHFLPTCLMLGSRHMDQQDTPVESSTLVLVGL